MKFGLSNRLLLLVALFSITMFEAGCGGSGSPSSVTPSTYIFDSVTPPITASEVVPSGYASNGAWMPIATDTSVSPAGGFYTGSTYTAFPVGQLSGDTVSIESAGGHYAWANYTKPSGSVGIAILDTSSTKLVTVDNVSLSNEGVASPDGTSAFVSIYDSSGNDTGTYELVSATGTVTALPIKSTLGYVVSGHAANGWTVVNYTSSSFVRKQNDPLSARVRVHTLGGGNAPLLISSSGTVTTLQSTNGQVNCVNNNGTSAGFDTISGVDNPVRWDTSGKETILKGLGASGSGRIYGIADSGVMVGGIDGGSIPMLWQTDGTVVNLATRVTVTGKEAFNEGLEIQADGKILGYGLDSSGNSALLAITPTN